MYFALSRKLPQQKDFLIYPANSCLSKQCSKYTCITFYLVNLTPEALRFPPLIITIINGESVAPPVLNLPNKRLQVDYIHVSNLKYRHAIL